MLSDYRTLSEYYRSSLSDYRTGAQAMACGFGTDDYAYLLAMFEMLHGSSVPPSAPVAWFDTWELVEHGFIRFQLVAALKK